MAGTQNLRPATKFSTTPARKYDGFCDFSGRFQTIANVPSSTSCVLPTNFHYLDGNPTAGRTQTKSGKYDILSYFACHLETTAQQKRSPLVLSHADTRTALISVTVALPLIGNQAQWHGSQRCHGGTTLDGKPSIRHLSKPHPGHI